MGYVMILIDNDLRPFVLDVGIIPIKRRYATRKTLDVAFVFYTTG